MNKEQLLEFMDSLSKEDRKALICELINIYCGNESIAGKANLEHLNDREKRLEEALKAGLEIRNDHIMDWNSWKSKAKEALK
jgi:hypothetical protein